MASNPEKGVILDILHVPYTYWPDAVGGTEIYVAALVRELRELGLESGIAAPGRVEDGSPSSGVFRWPVVNPVTDAAYGRPDPASGLAFRDILLRTNPRIVHLHARTSAVSTLLLHEARAVGARTVFTYHSPSASCMRGTMMLEGREPCDGRLIGARCTRCVLLKNGVPEWAVGPLSGLPTAVGAAAASVGLRRGPWLALRMRQLVENAHRDTQELLEQADRVVAVCDWVADVLRRNGVHEPRLVVNRQGIARELAGEGEETPSTARPLRVAYFGRLDAAKGVDVLIRAALACDDVELDIYGISQGEHDGYARTLEKVARENPRIRFKSSVGQDDVATEMRHADVVAVPSIGLETGPLVVLEAFSAGRPVLGSRLGGIAELVRDGVDGCLIAAGDVAAWTASMNALAVDPARLAHLRAGIRPPRTMRDVAVDMNRVYAKLLSDTQRAA
jgi:glycosyltransferase involved in cell wall biosynthesis